MQISCASWNAMPGRNLLQELLWLNFWWCPVALLHPPLKLGSLVGLTVFAGCRSLLWNCWSRQFQTSVPALSGVHHSRISWKARVRYIGTVHGNVEQCTRLLLFELHPFRQDLLKCVSGGKWTGQSGTMQSFSTCQCDDFTTRSAQVANLKVICFWCSDKRTHQTISQVNTIESHR